MTIAYIPRLGESVRVVSDATIRVYEERRNEDLLDLIESSKDQRMKSYQRDFPTWFYIMGSSWAERRSIPEHELEQHLEAYRKDPQVAYLPYTLPAGTILTINRIYIRQGQDGFDSVTFWARIPGVRKKVRFWLKLNEFNALGAEVVEESVK